MQCAKAIDKLIEKGVYLRVSHVQFLSKYFLREKSNEEMRFILNLKNLNKLMDTPHFKIENMKTVLKMPYLSGFVQVLGNTPKLISLLYNISAQSVINQSYISMIFCYLAEAQKNVLETRMKQYVC